MVDIKCKIIEVCIFSFQSNTPAYLLLHRSDDEKIYPGIWQFISGGIHSGEKAYEAAYREFVEETNFRFKKFYNTPHVTVFYDADYNAVNTVPLFAAEVGYKGVPALTTEHSDYRWCTFDEAVELVTWPGQKDGLRIVQDFLTQEKLNKHLVEISHLLG